MRVFEKNLLALEAISPGLAQTLRQLEDRGVKTDRRLLAARTGHLYAVELESAYNPHREYELKMAAELERLSGVPLLVGFLSGAQVEVALRHLEQVDLVVLDVSLFVRCLQEAELGFDVGRVRQVFLFDERNAVVAAFSRLGEAVYNDRFLILNPRYLEGIQASLGGFRLWLKRLLQGKPSLLFVSPITGGSFNIARYLHLAAQSLGFPAILQDNRGLETQHAKLLEGDDPVETQAFFDRLTEESLRAISQHQIDVLIGVSQSPLPERLVRTARKAGVLCVYWFIENHRLFRHYRDIVHLYDRFFVIQGSGLLKELREQGHRHAGYLPMACMPGIHRPLALGPDERLQFGAAVSFMGSAYANRIRFFEKLVPDLQRDFKLWGTHWGDSPVLTPYHQKTPESYLSDETIVKIYNASAINLNHHSDDQDGSHLDYLNPRAFEIPACGGFQLIDRRDELASLFAPDEVVAYDNLEDLRRRIAYFSIHPDERNALSDRARKRVLREHTYEMRLAQMLDTSGSTRVRIG